MRELEAGFAGKQGVMNPRFAEPIEPSNQLPITSCANPYINNIKLNIFKCIYYKAQHAPQSLFCSAAST